MEYISTDLLEEGLVVAKDVHSQSKMLLIPTGTELTASKIQMLKTWGIRQIFIESTESLDSTQIIDKRKLTEEFVHQRFSHNNDNEFIRSLKMATTRYLHRRKLEKP